MSITHSISSISCYILQAGLPLQRAPTREPGTDSLGQKQVTDYRMALPNNVINDRNNVINDRNNVIIDIVIRNNVIIDTHQQTKYRRMSMNLFNGTISFLILQAHG